MARTAVTRLTLTDLRNHQNLVLAPDTGCRIVALSGHNGAGKTNILEALSLLAPGRGLRRASSDLLLRMSDPKPTAWALAAELIIPAGTTVIGTGSALESLEARRIVQIDGYASTHQDLAHSLAVIWLTPEMDRLFADSAGERRRFFDRLVTGFDPAHAGRISRYEQAMRHRLKLLLGGKSDPVWLSALEETMTTSAIAITAARLDLIQNLNIVAAHLPQNAFPSLLLDLDDESAVKLQTQPALIVEDWLKDALKLARQNDTESQMTTLGPHRADLLAQHVQKNCAASLCSTGEQKALLIALILAYARLVEQRRGTGPILLLDDVTSHLDERRRSILFESLDQFSGQAWLSGTDDTIFSLLGPNANRYHIEPGLAQKIS